MPTKIDKEAKPANKSCWTYKDNKVLTCMHYAVGHKDLSPPPQLYLSQTVVLLTHLHPCGIKSPHDLVNMWSSTREVEEVVMPGPQWRLLGMRTQAHTLLMHMMHALHIIYVGNQPYVNSPQSRIGIKCSITFDKALKPELYTSTSTTLFSRVHILFQWNKKVLTGSYNIVTGLLRYKIIFLCVAWL